MSKESLNLPHDATIPEVVVSAAIRWQEDGVWVVLPSVRHFDRLTHTLLDKLGHTSTGKRVYEQGFVTNKFRYVSRTEAYAIAEEQGQFMRRSYNAELFSENLY